MQYYALEVSRKVMMKVQVLVATIHQQDFSKVDEMNLKTDAVFANQAGHFDYEEREYDFGKVKMITTATKGVGVNRNIALLHGEEDILLFADDDLTYYDDYERKVLDAFKENPDADGFLFNFRTTEGKPLGRVNKDVKVVKLHNAMAYGAINIAVKRTAIKRETIMFNTNFGGGTDFSAGEDSLFIADMLKHGLKLYTSPEFLGIVDAHLENSTWFRGYNEKYFYDKGVFFRALSSRWSCLLCLQDLLRHRKYRKNGFTFSEAFGYMKKGMKGYRDLIPYGEAYQNRK